MTVKILHTADNHLDPAVSLYYPKIMERRADFWRAFKWILDYAIEHKPDIMLISGDLYDRVNPRNPPRVQLLKYFRKLHSMGVRVFLIGGHHDTPRSEEEGASPLDELAASGYVTYFSSPKNFQAELVKIGDLEVCVSGITYNFDLREGEDPLSHSKPPVNGDINITMLHYPIEGFQASSYRGEALVKIASIPRDIDYVAAGHLHSFQETIREKTRIAYPGSTERRSFLEEKDEKKGFLWIEFDNEGFKREFVEVPTRPMKTIKHMLNPQSRNPVNEIIVHALKYRDKNLVLRIKISGKVPLHVLTRYRRDEIFRRLIDHFFIIVIDDSELEYGVERIETGVKLSPLQAFSRYMDKLLEEEKDPSRKEVIRLAKRVGLERLKEAGAW